MPDEMSTNKISTDKILTNKISTGANYFLAALQKVEGVGRGCLRRLLEAFDDSRIIWETGAAEIQAKTEISMKQAAAIANFCRDNPDEPQKLADFCHDREFKLYSLHDPEYPPLLKEIFDPPALIFCWGDLSAAPAVAIVGSRRSTPYGLGVAENMGRDLAAAGMVVVSGAARGIDTAAHKGALKGGKTIAVLGCGLDVAYPPENRRLLAQIATEGGAVISEFLPGTSPLPANFPARNRIISGLAQGTLVVEAPLKSGALITAELALSNGRDVFAIPANIYAASSMGCHRLIQQGAKLVVSPNDILEEYGLRKKSPVPTTMPTRLTGEELAVYQVLDTVKPMSTDEIIFKLNRGDASNVAVILLQMELKGYVESNGQHEYIRKEKE